VPAAVLEAAGRCVTVARYGVGLDNIDIETATRLGIVVSNVPSFCTDEVADHTMALVLAHARHVVPFATGTAGGRWDNRAHGPMHRLRGRVLGLVGYGAIARKVAVRARAFGFEVIAYSRARSGEPSGDGVRFAADLPELLAIADVVSLHVPLTPATRGLIGRAELAVMKPGAVLVNTARGALVDEATLIEALRDGQLGGAALDVLDGEPPAQGHPLPGMPTVIVTPHAAFDSVEAIAELQKCAARNVAAVLLGRPPATIVNREVLDQAELRMIVDVDR
jgi:D-3-phosphoglycerate dehydrogenase